jgi:hypothetical protein
VPERLLRNLGARVSLVFERDVEPPALTGTVAAWAREQHTTGRRGPGIALLLGFVTGSTTVVLAASGSQQPWDWPAVQAVAERQVARL